MDMHAPRAEEAMLVISASLRGPKRLNLTPSEVNMPDFHLAPPLCLLSISVVIDNIEHSQCR